MTIVSNKIKIKRHIHFTYRHRRLLEEYLREGMNVLKIANLLGFSRQSIYNEIKRGLYTHRNSDWTEEKRYFADIAQQKADLNLKAKGGKLKIDKDIELANFIENMIINKGYSPKAILNYIKTHNLAFSVDIKSVNTIYSYIDKGVFYKLERKHLPRRKKYRPTKRILKRDVGIFKYKNRPKELSIENRPQEIGDRSSFGHWEMDCVVGKKTNRKTLLVLTERYSRYEIIEVLKSKSVDQVTKALNRIEKRLGALFYKVFKSITVDNGSEFLNFHKLTKSLRRKGNRFRLYYCHPYSSYERGSNENNNILIRRWLPKGSDFDKILKFRLVKNIEQWMNSYPRDIFNGLSSRDIFEANIINL